ncbi:c-type cytochrome [Melioribacter sp. OK-6-Me]|uniref:c-type cytochrome n=1 Tax=unclassified Melioribacter TaxID=2627329 RepID=UPI003ED8B98B
MKSKLISLIFILIFGSTIFFNCDDTINQSELDSRPIPLSNISYAEHIQPVFDAKCNYSGCHNDADMAGGLSLTSHQNTTANYLIVAQGYPDNSRLVLAVEGRTVNPMPPLGYWPLTDNQIRAIRTWVKEGAKNN